MRTQCGSLYFTGQKLDQSVKFLKKTYCFFLHLIICYLCDKSFWPDSFCFSEKLYTGHHYFYRCMLKGPRILCNPFDDLYFWHYLVEGCFLKKGADIFSSNASWSGLHFFFIKIVMDTLSLQKHMQLFEGTAVFAS